MIRSLKNIIIPERIDSYYLISQRVVGLDITKTEVNASKIFYKGSSITLEQFITVQLDTDQSKTYEQRVTAALKTIVKQVGSCDLVRSSLSSSYVIFKELTLPFSDTEKIAKVLPFELEPFLPFSLAQSVTDFIVIESTTNQATILAAAVKREYIQQHINLYAQSGITPDVITVDLFDLYGLYKFIPLYAHSKKTVALLDMGITETRIAYLDKGRLSFVRTLPQGLSHLVKEIAKHENISPVQAQEQLIRFGFDANNDESYTKALEDTFKPFLDKIQFTLQSFASRLKSGGQLDQLLLLGAGSEVSGICRFINNSIKAKCQLFDCNDLLSIKSISLKKGHKIPQSNILSVGTALITPVIKSFNLAKEDMLADKKDLFAKQFFTGIGLIVVLFMLLIGNSWWQIRRLSKASKKLSNAIVSTLKKSGLTDERRLKKALADAQQNVHKQETIWFAFSARTRFSMLKYLETLSNAIDRIGVGLKLEKLTISEKDNTISLQATVRDFDALKVLEKELKQSNLFTYVPSLQNTKFTISLPLKKADEEE